MSDYLTNLVERSLNSGNLVTPRLPSVFERAPITLDSASLETTYILDGEPASATPDFTAPAPQLQRNLRGHEPVSPTDSEVPEAIPHVKTNGIRSEDGPSPAERETRFSDLSAPADESEAPEFQSRASEGQAPSVVIQRKEERQGTIADHVAIKNSRMFGREGNETAIEPGSIETTRATLKPGAVIPTQTSSLEAITKQAVANHDGVDIVQPAPTRLESRAERQTASAVNDRKTLKANNAASSRSPHDPVGRNQAEDAVPVDVRKSPVSLPTIQSRNRPANVAQFHREAEVTSEPTINVTIGRVEVRAMQDAPPRRAPTRQSGSPVMPLEEYLQKQRRGGER